MRGQLPNPDQGNLFYPRLREQLNPEHPLYLLADKIDWSEYEQAFGQQYSHTGRPAHPIRLMVGLLILKQLDNLGDETVVKKWVENPYYQYFTGMVTFQWQLPIAPSDLVHFRNRIGEAGAQLIFRHSFEIHGKDACEQEVVADTTVQEKDITYPTDAKLYNRGIQYCRRIAKKENLPLRQSDVRVVPKLMKLQYNARHPRRYKPARQALRKLHTIAGRMVRELERNLSAEVMPVYEEVLHLFHKVLNQQRKDKNKVYSLHAPEVSCISKGKVHPRYEYGSKASIIKTKTSGIIVAALNFQGNPYDGHTIAPTLDQYAQLHKTKRPKVLIYDRGGRGIKEQEGTQILLPAKPKQKATPYQKRKARQRFRRRAAIEPVIGHLKHRFGLKKNGLKGQKGDQINLLLSCAAFNFAKWMKQIEPTLIVGMLLGIFTLKPQEQRYAYRWEM